MLESTDKNKLMEYINGEKFSDMFYYVLEDDNEYLNRKEFLKTELKGKSVVHLGFADHLDGLDTKITTGTWLHANITEVTKECIGIDVNSEVTNYLKEKHNIKNIYVADITDKEQMDSLLTGKYDYLIIPDVMEHIDNPIGFLAMIRELHSDKFDEIIITVPNAFAVGNFMNAYGNTECINSDHNYWFTPFTLTKVLNKANYNVEKIKMLEHGEIDKKSDIYNTEKDTPIMRNTIAVVCTFAEGE